MNAINSPWIVPFLKWRDSFQRGSAGGSAYPVMRRDLHYWDDRLGGRWRLGEWFGLLALGTVCVLPATLLLAPNMLWFHIGIVELIGILLIIPAAGAIAREREQGSWQALRSTQLSGLEIAASKLASVLYLTREGMSIIVRARVLASFLTFPLLAFLLFLPQGNPFFETSPLIPLFATMAIAYGLFVFQPQLHAIYSANVGLAASTIARGVMPSIALALSIQLASLAAGAALVYASMSSDYLDAVFSDGVLSARLTEIFSWLFPLAAIILVRLLFGTVCFSVAVSRIRRIAA